MSSEIELYSFEDIKFCNTTEFSRAAQFYKKHGVYTFAPDGSREHTDFWDEEEKRRIEGLSLPGQLQLVNGIWQMKDVHITGEHYGFLNYARIFRTKDTDSVEGKKELKNVVKDSVLLKHARKIGKKDADFPSFFDGQYHYFKAKEFARLNGLHVVVGKARRKGFSYIEGWDSADTINMNPNVTVLVCAYDLKYLTKGNQIMGMAKNYLDFLELNTDWNRGYISESKEVIELGYKLPGTQIKRGYRSQIIALSFGGNPDAAAGKDAIKIKVEECFAKGTRVVMFDGTLKCIEDIIIGDLVMGIDSNPKEVFNTCNGLDEMFEIEQSKGNNYTVNSKHLLYLEQKCNTLSIKDDGIKYIKSEDFNKLGKYKFRTTYGIKSSGIEYDKKDLLIEPYYLGLWLGDGDASKPSLIINKERDIEIYNYIYEYANRINLNVREYFDKRKPTCINLTILERPDITNVFFKLFKDYEVVKNKYIPYDYITSNLNDRLEILAGLLDSDGYLQYAPNGINCSFEITQVNTQLANEILYLSRSCGFSCSMVEKKTSIKDKFEGITNRIRITGDIHKIPTKVLRKKAKEYIKTSNPLNTQIKITSKGIGEYYGFTLKGENEIDNLFLLEDFTIVKNCGKAPNLEEFVEITLSTTEAGDIQTGQMVFFGTGGTDDANWEAFKKIHDNPTDYDCMAFDNIWDEGAKGTGCGFFYPHILNLEPYIDVHGNSDLVAAKIASDAKRATKKRGGLTNRAYMKYVGQRANTPREAFSYDGDNIFTRPELFEHLQNIENNPDIKNLGRLGTLVRSATGLRFEYNSILSARDIPTHPPILDYPHKQADDVHGCFVEWYSPFRIDGRIPKGLYRIWNDPVAIDKNKENITVRNSLACTYVFERCNNLTPTRGDILVAMYIGRPETMDEYNEQLLRVTEYYGGEDGQCMFENNTGDVEKFFARKKKSHLLAGEPEAAWKKELQTKKTGRKGILMNTTRIGSAALYFRDWVFTVRGEDEYGNKKMNLHYINDVGLLREMIKFNSKGNFDRLSTIFVGQMDIQEQFDVAVKTVEKKDPNDYFNRPRY